MTQNIPFDTRTITSSKSS